ncbi:MAG: c-type cytochrome [Pseudomonadota bacterium]|nr:c-type cytochrome [Pseudomonadota bacterium]
MVNERKNVYEFLDLILITIGVVICIMVGILFIATQASQKKQNEINRQSISVQLEISSRIAPIGKIAIDGEKQLENLTFSTSPREELKKPLLGEQVYKQACNACHSSGVAGAPKFGDSLEWEQRLAEGIDSLNNNAIKGFQGDFGFMPAKGGFIQLSDDEVRTAVQYIIDESL